MTRVAGLVLLLILAAIGVWLALMPLAPLKSARQQSLIDENNRAVGLMGRYDYDAAREVFAELVRRDPDWHDVRVNLAIATLNRQRDGDTEAALAILEDVLEADPDNLRALYCEGLLRLYRGSPADALSRFEAVAAADPEDAYAAYYVAVCRAQLQQHEEAAAAYERARALDPYLQSAYYGLAQTYQRLGRPEDARAMAEAFDRLRDNPRAKLVDFRYTRMGAKGEALAVDVDPPPPAPVPEGPLFAPPVELAMLSLGAEAAAGRPRATSVTTCDVDGDGRLDVFIAGPGARSTLLVHDAGGALVAAADHPLSGLDGVNAALWGDVDNDGRVDVYLCRDGVNALWRQDEGGTWTDVTAAFGAGGGPLDTVDGALFDADHDGDLDIFLVNADGADVLLSNNLDGTFRDITAETGLGGGGRASRQVLVGDLDADRDLDIAVVHETPPHAVYLNDRLWSYRPADGAEPFTARDLAAAAVADDDADGRASICAVERDGALRAWTLGSDGAWTARALGSAPGRSGDVADPGRLQLAVLDLDGDVETLEWIVGDERGWRALRPGGATRSDRGESALRGWTTAARSPAAGPSIVGVRPDGRVLVWPPGSGRHAFVGLTFTGKEDAGDGMRSNASGIGAEVAARVGSRWSTFTTIRPGSGPGQSLQPWLVGLAGRPALDFVRIEWPDGVLQTEVHGVPALPDQPRRDLSAGAVARIEEIQRQKSSCPVLFVWDGTRHRFVSDVLGVGGLGYLIEPGTYAPPRPWERLLLPDGVAAPRDGAYELELAEPMEEACYLDAARLVAWDLPPGWRAVPDDRMATGGPEPTGAMQFYRVERLPTRAVNERGDDVTSRIIAADLEAAPVGRLDHRFLGRLAGEHVLELSFAAPLDEGAGTAILIVDGWVEYPYSQTMFAAWQASADYRPPTLEALDRDGRWVVVLESFGYPAGMPRRMSVPLDGLPEGATRLRLRTNQEIYWDRVAVARAEPCPDAERVELPLESASLRVVGFAKRTTGPQRLPRYDAEATTPFWDARHQEGMYTAIGDCRPLVEAADDAVAIFGPGEAVRLRFASPDRPPPDGWTRRLVLEVEGWCKDMDLYTRDGDTLAPLPSRGGPSPDVERLHERFNTRYRVGY